MFEIHRWILNQAIITNNYLIEFHCYILHTIISWILLQMSLFSYLPKSSKLSFLGRIKYNKIKYSRPKCGGRFSSRVLRCVFTAFLKTLIAWKLSGNWMDLEPTDVIIIVCNVKCKDSQSLLYSMLTKILF